MGNDSTYNLVLTNFNLVLTNFSVLSYSESFLRIIFFLFLAQNHLYANIDDFVFNGDHKSLLKVIKIEKNINRKSTRSIESDGTDSLLHVAVYKEHHKCAEILLKNSANPNNLNTHSQSPLHYAVLNGNINLVKLLLKFGANINAKKSGWRYFDCSTPYELAKSRSMYMKLDKAKKENAKLILELFNKHKKEKSP